MGKCRRDRKGLSMGEVTITDARPFLLPYSFLSFFNLPQSLNPEIYPLRHAMGGFPNISRTRVSNP